ncbi:RICIN domain-containing protein [Streptomyces sp. NPDC057908]|uniref:RICIN domain-containing protein n=1 Tax=Streptomyces sp. NPDC057908 TaxID=3346276 RepID=UPI0036E697A6
MFHIRGVKAKLAALAMAGASVVALSSTASAAPAASDVILYNLGTKQCLAVLGSSAANGAELAQWTCSTNDDQYWALEPVAGGDGDRVRVRNRNSDKCLAIGSSSTENGAGAIQWTCSTNTDQLWIHDGSNRLRNVNSDRCLAIPNASTAPGTKAIQWTCSTSADQQWGW